MQNHYFGTINRNLSAGAELGGLPSSKGTLTEVRPAMPLDSFYFNFLLIVDSSGRTFRTQLEGSVSHKTTCC